MHLLIQFDVGKINVSSSRLNPTLLDECNRQEIIQKLKDPHTAETLIEEVVALVKSTYPDK